MSDKHYGSVRQPLKIEIFMLLWISTESIHNDRLSCVGSSALGREPFSILFWSKVSKGVCGTLFVEESNIFGDLPRETSSADVMCKSVNNSAFTHPLMDSMAALSVGVPALDMDLVMLYMARISL